MTDLDRMRAFFPVYWAKQPKGTIRNTHELRGAFTGQIQIDIGIDVRDSLNASVGTFHSREGAQFGVEPQIKDEPFELDGRSTTTSYWIKVSDGITPTQA